MADIPMMTERDIVKAFQELNQSTSHLATINIVLTVAHPDPHRHTGVIPGCQMRHDRCSGGFSFAPPLPDSAFEKVENNLWANTQSFFEAFSVENQMRTFGSPSLPNFCRTLDLWNEYAATIIFSRKRMSRKFSICNPKGQWQNRIRSSKYGTWFSSTSWEYTRMSKYELIIFWSEEDQAFVVEVPELPGCMADGATYVEAVTNAQRIIEEWIDTAKELGRPIPAPRGRLMYA
jgi:predicted RNase H-like HicB family nuclease